MTQPSRAPGWYPDPSDPSRNNYWDGNAWQGSPAAAEADKSSISKQTGVAIGVCVLAAVGLVMSMQSVSLMTGSGPVWTGVAIAAIGLALAFFLGASKWARVIVIAFVAASVLNAITIEIQLSKNRAEFNQKMSDISNVFRP